MVRVFVLVQLVTAIWISQPTDASTALRADATVDVREAAAAIESVGQVVRQNCIVSPWKPDPAGVCDPVTLKQPFKRTIVVPPANNGRACPTPLQQDRPCWPVNCQLGPWSPWSACVNEYKIRTRSIVVQPNAVGRPCRSQLDRVKCHYQDCEVSEWGDWVCDSSSGDQTRTRRITRPSQPSGAACPALSEKKPCDPINCKLEERSASAITDSEWGECEPDGNGGFHQIYVLKIVTPAQFKGTACPLETDPSRVLTRSCEVCAAPQSGVHFGNDLTLDVWTGITQSECCAKCGGTTGCKAYTFRPAATGSQGDCYTKSGTTTTATGLSNRYVSATMINSIPCPAPPGGLAEGKSLVCESGGVARYTCGKFRPYPNPTIAASWDPFWLTGRTSWPCSSLVRGEDMGFKPCPALPNGIPEGLSVKCDDSHPVYRATCGEVRWYPNPEIARSWDVAWGQPRLIDCTDIPRGADMPLRVCPNPPFDLEEGQSVKCIPGSNPYETDDGRVYRYECNEIRWYPNPNIAASWDANWYSYTMIDCGGLQVGPDIPYARA